MKHLLCEVLRISENTRGFAKSRPSCFRSDKQLFTLLATPAAGRAETSWRMIGRPDWSCGGGDLRLHRAGSRWLWCLESSTAGGPNATEVGLGLRSD